MQYENINREHALLSASGAKRWMSCPPSALLEDSVDETTSVYAEEGTYMHALAELQLNYYIGTTNREKFKKDLETVKENKFYSEEIYEAVQIYVDFVIERISSARAITKDAIVLIEQRLDFSEWVDSGFGTGDAVIIADNVLEIIDLKGGKGVQVFAEENPQMRLYALGAIHQFSCLYDIKKIKMTICQPRLDSISTDEIEVSDLLKWAETEVKPKADLAIEGKGEFKSGQHCRFCRVRYTCRERVEENTKLACMEFKAPPLLTDEEIVEVLSQAEELEKWASDVSTYALNKAINEGKEWTGYKLVEGRSSRKYKDETIVSKALIEAGYEENKIYSKSLLTITAMEKEIGKKKFSELLGTLVEKVPGKLKLVSFEDKRPEIKNTAEIDFKEEI